jgi:hypothetical protein
LRQAEWTTGSISLGLNELHFIARSTISQCHSLSLSVLLLCTCCCYCEVWVPFQVFLDTHCLGSVT